MDLRIKIHLTEVVAIYTSCVLFIKRQFLKAVLGHTGTCINIYGFNKKELKGLNQDNLCSKTSILNKETTAAAFVFVLGSC